MTESASTKRTRSVLSLAFAVLLMGTVSATAQLRLDPYVSGLNAPVGFVQDPSTPSVQYVVQQAGLIRVIRNGILLPTPFLDVASIISCCGERGLLGLAFPPDYGASGRFFVNFTNPAGHTVVARFLRSAGNPLVADFSSRFDLRWGSGQRFITQPFANHNGGHIVFGPDGYLYIGMGDGGSGDDPQHNAQNPATLLGKMLRININVSSADPNGYVVPADNPFPPGNPLGALPEIWAFGLRNPWKFAFDPPALGGTGAMFIGDVGQQTWEEIDYQPAGVGGRNYGWRNREGAHPNPHSPLNGGDLPPAYMPLIDPIVEYQHPVGSSVTGGVVYRGQGLSAVYRGRYFYADLNARVWSVALVPAAGGEVTTTPPVEHTQEIGSVERTGLVTAIGTDAFGEIYIVGYSTGAILKLVDPTRPTVPPPAADFNGDRRPDLVWFHEGMRRLAAWNMGGGTYGEKLITAGLLTAPTVNAGWRVVGTADADGDGQTDLFLQSDDGQLGVWFFDGPVFRSGMLLNPGMVSNPLWRIRAVADFNHDGHPDLVWQYGPTGQVAFWLMNGVNVIGYAVPAVGSPGSDWHVIGTGDSNHDGDRDLFWQHRTMGTLAVWRMHGTEFGAGLALSASPSDVAWQAVGTADLDGDGNTDVLFQRVGNGSLAAWYLTGETVRFGLMLDPNNAGDPNWKVVGPR